MFRNPFSPRPEDRKLFAFRIGKLHFAKNDRLESATGFKRWKDTTVFIDARRNAKQQAIYAQGFEACQKQVVTLIHESQKSQNAGARVRQKSWDDGFETALTFVEKKVVKFEPPTT